MFVLTAWWLANVLGFLGLATISFVGCCGGKKNDKKAKQTTAVNDPKGKKASKSGKSFFVILYQD